MTSLTERIANLQIEYIIATVIVLLIARIILGRYKSKAAKSVTEIVESALIAIVLVFLVIRPFVVQAFFIPSESMEPTLLTGDRLLVNKFIYRFTDPKHGDIIVFKSPPAANEARSESGPVMVPLQVDRARALSDWNEVAGKVMEAMGDKGEVRIHPTSAHGGEYGEIEELCLLGKSDSIGEILPMVKHTYAADNYDLIVKFVGIDDRPAAEALVGKEARIGEKDYIKRVIGIPGDTLEVKELGVNRYGEQEYALYRNNQPLDEPYIMAPPDYAMPKIKIPKGMLFMMGDNRRNSNDSHKWGTLDRRRVVGKAMVIFWPLNRIRVVR